MDDVKEKTKDLIKKFRNPFVVTPKFKGQGHKLGSQSSTASSSASSSNGTDTKSSPWRKPESEQRQQQQQGDWRKLQQEKWERERTSNLSSNEPHRGAVSEEMPPLSSSTDAQRPSQNFLIAKAASTPTTAAAFDPFTSVIGSHKSSSLNLTQEKNVQCPVCQKWWNSETEVSAHLEECLATSSSGCMDGSDGGRGGHGSNGGRADHSIDGGGREYSSGGGRGGHNDDGSDKSMQDLGEAVRILLLGGPSNATLGVFVRLLSNILGDSKAEKFRRVRLANPKIRETVGMALGGVEFLESVGFHLIADGEEVVAVMDETSETQLGRIKQALVLLEPHYVSGSLPSITASQLSSQSSVPANQPELRKVDRQV
jgi:UBX domain-containing protein 6